MKFTMTMDHVKLLNRMNVIWDGDDDWGVPSIDSKRPYGNGDVLGDVCQIVGWEKEGDDGDGPCWSSLQLRAANVLHRQMLMALQIWLATGACVLGEYTKTNKYDSSSWTRTT